jgi:hypothetical protein
MTNNLKSVKPEGDGPLNSGPGPVDGQVPKVPGQPAAAKAKYVTDREWSNKVPMGIIAYLSGLSVGNLARFKHCFTIAEREFLDLYCLYQATAQQTMEDRKAVKNFQPLSSHQVFKQLAEVVGPQSTGALLCIYSCEGSQIPIQPATDFYVLIRCLFQLTEIEPLGNKRTLHELGFVEMYLLAKAYRIACSSDDFTAYDFTLKPAKVASEGSSVKRSGILGRSMDRIENSRQRILARSMDLARARLNHMYARGLSTSEDLDEAFMLMYGRSR